jgi:hypothetical protein
MTRVFRWSLVLLGLWLLSQALRVAWFWFGPVEAPVRDGMPPTALAASVPASAIAQSEAALSAGPNEPAPARVALLEPLAHEEARYCKRAKGLERQVANWTPETLRDNAPAIAHLAREFTGLNNDLVSLRERHFELLATRLAQAGGQRNEAIGLTLRFLGHDDQRRDAAAVQMGALAESSQDPLVLKLATLTCRLKGCVSKLTERWTALEPDNAYAWLSSEAPPDVKVQRVSQASRWDDHWPALLKLLNQAAPPDAQSTSDAMLTIGLIGVEVAMQFSALPRAVCSPKSTAEQKVRCLAAAERLWQLGAPPSIGRFIDAKQAFALSGGSSVWAQRLAEQQAFLNFDQRLFADEAEVNLYLLGCAPAQDNTAFFMQQFRQRPRHEILREALQRSGHSTAEWAAASASSPLQATLR